MLQTSLPTSSLSGIWIEDLRSDDVPPLLNVCHVSRGRARLSTQLECTLLAREVTHLQNQGHVTRCLIRSAHFRHRTDFESTIRTCTCTARHRVRRPDLGPCIDEDITVWHAYYSEHVSQTGSE